MTWFEKASAIQLVQMTCFRKRFWKRILKHRSEIYIYFPNWHLESPRGREHNIISRSIKTLQMEFFRTMTQNIGVRYGVFFLIRQNLSAGISEYRSRILQIFFLLKTYPLTPQGETISHNLSRPCREIFERWRLNLFEYRLFSVQSSPPPSPAPPPNSGE